MPVCISVLLLMLTMSTLRKHRLSKGKEATRLRRRYIAHEDFFVFHLSPFQGSSTDVETTNVDVENVYFYNIKINEHDGVTYC